MTFARKFVYQGVGAVLKLLLLILPGLFALSMLFGSSTSVKEAFRDSGFYTQFVGATIDQTRNDSADPQTKQLLADPGIQQAINATITPGVLQTNTHKVIDGVFDWIHGKTPEPQFTIDLSETRTKLAQAIASYAEARTNQLPVCTLQQLQQLGGQIDLLSIPCRPPGLNIKAAAEAYSQQLLANEGPLQKPVITNDTLFGKDNADFNQQTKTDIPAAYKKLNLFKWLALISAIVLAAVLILARADRAAGIRHVALALLSVGILWGLGIILFWLLFGVIKPDDQAMTQILFKGLRSLATNYTQIVGAFAAGYIALGVGALMYLRRQTQITP